MKKICCALLAAMACGMAACAAPAELQSPWHSSSSAMLGALPPGAELERAGSQPVDPDQVATTIGSYAPDSGGSPMTRVPEILARGYIIAGVAQSQNLLSFQDPTTRAMTGFEVDVAREIARDIFGDPSKVDFRFIDGTNQVAALEAQQVDIVLDSMSITRARLDQLSFSTPYFEAKTELLTQRNSSISTIADLPGKTVCSVFGSTGVQRIRAYAPQSNILKLRTWSDCLVALQQNQVDAILSDDAILAGMVSQDPTTRIVPVDLSTEEYGVGIASPSSRHNTLGLIRQVNATIERLRAGAWYDLYNRWFAKYLGSSPQLPPLKYRSENPS